MAISTIQYALTAGEVSEQISFRYDYEKFDLSVQKAENWFVDYRGGLSTRHGTKYIATLPDANSNYRLTSYSISDAKTDNVIVIFYHNKIMFAQEEGVVLNGGTVYTVDSPFTSDALPKLNFKQDKKTIIITSETEKTHVLTRNDVADWTLSEYSFNPGVLPAPSNLAKGPQSTAGSAATLFAVTSVDKDGNESLSSIPFKLTDVTQYNVTDGQAELTWDKVPEAVSYNVYRGAISSTADGINLGNELGFVGKSFGTSFLDTNIIPDFTKTPLLGPILFEDSYIFSIRPTNGGSGYTQDATLTITDPTGTGFIGFPVVVEGVVENVIILSGGKNYTNPTVVLTDATGTGFTAVVEVSPSSGFSPRCSSSFQQRRVFAGTINQPISLTASFVGNKNNFILDPAAPNGGYSFELDADNLAPILHLEPTQGGLLLFTSKGLWLFSNQTDGATTADDYKAEPQAYTGAKDLPPLRVENQLLYVEARSAGVRLLDYNEFQNLFRGQDVSILSTHLFNSEIKSWAYVRDPFKQVLCIKENGTINALTLVEDQDVYAWTPYSTCGFYEEIAVNSTVEKDTPYFVVKRFINGQTVKFLEVQADRDVSAVENCWAVDAGLILEPTPSDVAAKINYDTKELVLSAAPAQSISVGDHVRINGGKLLISTKASETSFTFKINKEPKPDFWCEETPVYIEQAAGKWSASTPTKTIAGLAHLEGESVRILADGNVIENKTVTSGQITLDTKASKITVGLGYDCLLITQPVSVPRAVAQDKLRRIVGVAMSLLNSLGLRIGQTGEKLYPQKERSYEKYGEEIDLKSGIYYEPVQGTFNREATISIKQTNPVHSTVLGYTIRSEFGEA